LELQNPSALRNAIEINAELDSGAEYSLFEGQLAAAIGLECCRQTSKITKRSQMIEEIRSFIETETRKRADFSPLTAKVLPTVVAKEPHRASEDGR
jgi:hypothetical protein